ncbi:glycosyltransferase family 4 protein [Flexithrix dorotheae]|uniref:glycosyltransferase family 4 protein n=1 Tax=Flexithrix dorotheae TaxID=70993 RepID=UPI00036B9C1F|nr:glycosyltransferase family 4 protein [Flexithrix dorotheae]
MKIGFLCNSPSWGGLEINNYKLAQWLTERGHEVVMIAHSDYPIYKHSRDAGLPLIHFPARYKDLSLRACMRLSKTNKTEKFDTLILGVNQDIKLGVLTKKFGLGKTLLIYHQQIELGVNKRDFWHTSIYKSLDAWVTPLEVLANQVRERTNIDPDKIKIIPLCIDVNRFSENKMKMQEARENLDLPQEELIIGMVGRMDHQKGHAYFIEALGELRKKDIEVKGLICGVKEEDKGSEYLKSLESLAEKNGLKDQIYFRPFSKDVETAYKAMNIFVMASPAETFGMVTVEALACGVPVVGTNHLGTKEILKSGDYGLVFPPRDAKALSNCLEELIDDELLTSTLAAKGVDYVKSTYNFTRQCELFEQLITELKEKRG